MSAVYLPLSLYQSQDVFYCVDTAGAFQVADNVEFLLPIFTGGSLLLAWFVVLGILISLCKNGELYRVRLLVLLYTRNVYLHFTIQVIVQI